MGFLILGHLSAEAMEAEFSSADIFCLPSLAEGMASVALEALAHGVPCVLTRAAGVSLEDGVTGRVVPERDPEALAAALAEIATDRDRRQGMSAAALGAARNHELGAISQSLHAALAGLHGAGAERRGEHARAPA